MILSQEIRFYFYRQRHNFLIFLQNKKWSWMMTLIIDNNRSNNHYDNKRLYTITRIPFFVPRCWPSKCWRPLIKARFILASLCQKDHLFDSSFISGSSFVTTKMTLALVLFVARECWHLFVDTNTVFIIEQGGL